MGKKFVFAISSTVLVFAAVLMTQLYFALAPVNLARASLFRPVKVAEYKLPDKIMALPLQHLKFKSKNGNTLYGVRIEKPGAKYTFLCHGGQGGNLNMNIALAYTALMAGQSVFLYDYQGFGKSTGRPSCVGVVDNGLSAHDYLVGNCGIKPERIVQYGVSLGTGVAAAVAEKRTTAGVALFCPYVSLHRVAREDCPFLNIYPESLFPQPDLGAARFVATNSSVPILVWHGAKDPLIKVSHALDLQRLDHGNLLLCIEQDKEHGGWTKEGLADKMKEFLARLEDKQALLSQR